MIRSVYLTERYAFAWEPTDKVIWVFWLHRTLPILWHRAHKLPYTDLGAPEGWISLAHDTYTYAEFVSVCDESYFVNKSSKPPI
jgi:hypothetical protein